MSWPEGWLALLRKEFDGTRRSRRGEGRQVSEYDFGRTVKSESSATLYEATNRKKLNQERAWQIPKPVQGIQKTI
jgi:hypothetical protein